MAGTLNFASMMTLAFILAMVILFIAGSVRAIRAATKRAKREASGESAMLSMALHEAMTRLKQQERAMAARAEASEQLADQIVEGLTSGLVVVNRGGLVQAINPAARRILELGDVGPGKPFQQTLGSAKGLSDLIAEALVGTAPIARRTITLGGAKPQHLGVTVSHITDQD